jgi:hypothetical protein
VPAPAKRTNMRQTGGYSSIIKKNSIKFYQTLGAIYLAIVIASFLCSLISFRLHYPNNLKLFSVFLGITVLTELIAKYWFKLFHLPSNFLVYSLFMLIQYPILGVYYKQIIVSKFIRKVINIFLVVYPLFWLSIFLFVYGSKEWNSYGIMAGDLFITFFSVRYLFELFTSDKLVAFGNHSQFWIAVALIFYSCCELPITGIINYLLQDWWYFWNRPVKQIYTGLSLLNLYSILQILNIIMYSIFIYAFVCRVARTVRR